MFRPERVRPELDSIFGNTYDGVRNPMVAVERGYPTRNHGPIFTYVQPSFRYQRRPVARAPYAGLGDAVINCQQDGDCPAGLACCTGMADVGQPTTCMPLEACRQLQNAGAQAICAKTPGGQLVKTVIDGVDWIGCSTPAGAGSGSPLVPGGGSAATTPQGTPATSSSPASGSVSIPKVAIAVAGVLFLLAILS